MKTEDHIKDLKYQKRLLESGGNLTPLEKEKLFDIESEILVFEAMLKDSEKSEGEVPQISIQYLDSIDTKQFNNTKKTTDYPAPENLPNFCVWSTRLGAVQYIDNLLFFNSFCSVYKDLVFSGEYFYFYNIKENIWVLTDDYIVKALIIEHTKSFNVTELNSFMKSFIVNELLEYMKIEKTASNNFILCDKVIEFNTNTNLLYLKNTVIDTTTLNHLVYDKSFFNTYKIDVNYNENATCPHWLYFLNTALPEHLYPDKANTILRLQEWVGLLLTPIVKFQKCLFLFGSGANGKSIFINTIEKLLGDKASATDLDLLLGTNKFFLSTIMGKTANVATEVDVKWLNNSIFKTIVTGESVTADVKHKPCIKFKPFVKLIFSTNTLKTGKDNTEGFFRRFHVLEFKNKFEGLNCDNELQSKINNELEGILIWAVRGLCRLMKNNKFTDSEDFTNSFKEFRCSLDPLEEFLSNHTEKSESSADFITKKDFRDAYVDFCNAQKYDILPENQMGRQMKAKGFIEKQKTVEKKRTRIYTHVLLIE
jgi:P4 family phage/plasmid primase-like protien